MTGNNQLISDYIDLCEQQAELIDMQSAMIKALNEQIKNLDDLEHWVNPREKKYFVMKARQDKGCKLKYPLPKQPPASGKTLAKALRTMQEKYGIEVVFAKPKDAARVMVELLTER